MSKIIDINSLNDNECVITYEVLNSKKNSLYQKDSKQLLERMNRYIDFLYQKEKKLKEKNEDKMFYKRIFSIIFVMAITLMVVYFIMSIALSKPYLISLLGYIISLLLVGVSFLVVNGINYKSDLKIENLLLQNENEILRAESIRDNCLDIINGKNKSDKKTK